ncbi:MAG: YciI family protein [Caulobacteraceae bacterium]
MLFVVMAHFKEGAEEARKDLVETFTRHLGQRQPRIRLGGPLKDDQGARTGVFYIAESDTREAVETLVHSSPYYEAILYDRIEITRMDLELGSMN